MIDVLAIIYSVFLKYYYSHSKWICNLTFENINVNLKDACVILNKTVILW